MASVAGCVVGESLWLFGTRDELQIRRLCMVQRPPVSLVDCTDFVMVVLMMCLLRLV